MSVSILVVDDEPDVAELFRQRCRREKREGTYVMHFAASGEQALEEGDLRSWYEKRVSELMAQGEGRPADGIGHSNAAILDKYGGVPCSGLWARFIAGMPHNA
jgi:hypothetical protein